MAWLLPPPLFLACSLACAACSGTSEGSLLPPCASPEGVASTTEALAQCAGETVEGIDVFDGQGAIDWGAVADAGVAFAMIKATQGTYDTQSTFDANWNGAARAGVRRGAYHFFDPTEDGEAQARHFLSTVGVLGSTDLPPMLDLECPDGDTDCLGTGGSGTAPVKDIASRVRAWLQAVEVATSRKPFIYTFGSYFEVSGVDPTGLDAYPLFLAYPTTEACFDVPAPWTKASMWQYSWTGTVPGISTPVDRDRFLGSSAALAAFVDSATPVEAGAGDVDGAPGEVNGADAGGSMSAAGGPAAGGAAMGGPAAGGAPAGGPAVGGAASAAGGAPSDSGRSGGADGGSASATPAPGCY